MAKRYWVVFAGTQLLGVLFGLYAITLEVGVGGWREWVWVAPMVLLFPGHLLGALLPLGIFPGLGNWYGAPLLTAVVLFNAALWGLAARLARKE